MDLTHPTPLLSGLTPQTFMRRHWQKKPLLIRQAIPAVKSPLGRTELFELAGQDGVESRLVERHTEGWTLRHGPFSRRQLPSLKQAAWTLLVQGVDLQVDAAHELLSRFRFVPDARLDDLMISYATDGGGVGPHFDSYDVFLLQVEGRRRWRVGRMTDPKLQPDVPLKILAGFLPESEWLLEPGDMLYLPPRWAHDGVAEGSCMTCSIGFRSASRIETGREVMQRLIDVDETKANAVLYRDPAQPATQAPGRVPAQLQAFATHAVSRLVGDPKALAQALGEWLSEPKPQVWFDGGATLSDGAGIRLDRRSRMLYDDRSIFINGDSYRATGRDAALMRRLADRHGLKGHEVGRLSAAALNLLNEWAHAGWLHQDDRTENSA